MADLNDLKKKRGRAKAALTRIDTFVTTHENDQHLDVNELSIRESMLVSAFEEYNRIQNEIEELDDAEVADRVNVEDKYISIHTRIKGLVQIFSSVVLTSGSGSNSSNVTSTATSPAAAKAKLPSLNLPIFSGKYEEWMSFFDLFSALIDKDQKLTDAQKFLYLKSVLKNEPLSLVNNLQITDNNYAVALDILKKRYDNNLVIINSHIRALFDAQLVKGHAQALREFITKIKQNVNALKSLNVPIDTWDLILIYIFLNKLDFQTRKAFELERNSRVNPTYTEFIEFLEKRCLALESASQSDVTKGKTIKSSHHVTQSCVSSDITAGVNHGSKGGFYCSYCKGNNHSIYKCSKFNALAIDKKREFVKGSKLYYNCLGSKHQVTNCKSEGCRHCSGKHHSLLHAFQGASSTTTNISNTHKETEEVNEFPSNQNGDAQNSTLSHSISTVLAEVNETQTKSNLDSFPPKKGQILLATARINLVTQNGKRVQTRALLDSASQTSFVATRMVERLGLKGYALHLKVLGVGQSNAQVTHMVDLKVESKFAPNYNFETSFGILNKITCSLPHAPVDVSQLTIPNNLVLADDEFSIPSPIDVLIGADLYFDLIEPGIINLGPNLPVLQNSKLGWVIGGPAPVQRTTGANLSISLFSHSPNIEDLIPKFWQLEELQERRHLTYEGKWCEQLYTSTTTRTRDGSFQVNLPLKSDIELLNLGDSFSQASKRFVSLEKRLLKNPALHSQYAAFINEYVSLGHGKYVPLIENKDMTPLKYFLPHHCVIREDSSTTKLRVVFDAGMKTSTGLSLNEVMYKGYVVQLDLFDILCRFRNVQFVLTADIEKMYRQVKIHPRHRFLQNILWREEPTDPLQCIELQTVTYGTNSAPFLATRSLVELANTQSANYPLASSALLHQCYVDDILTGSNTLEGLLDVKLQLIDLLKSANFNLHKWCSNVPSLVNSELSQQRDGKVSIRLGNTSINKILGIAWDSNSDVFTFSSPSLYNSKVITKRQVLSNIAQMYDPLGFIGPIIVIGKMLMQSIWASKLEWDDPLPSHLNEKWKVFSENMEELTKLKIPRWIFSAGKVVTLEIHGFSDASLQAYGACVYVRALYLNGKVTSNLVCSRSRISPLKTISLPRLELCGSLLLAKLVHKFKSICQPQLNVSKTHLWTDSKIVLAWLKACPSRWTTFVANRVSEVQELTVSCDWHYVASSDNPADYLTRGVNPKFLISCGMWWHGPRFLMDSCLINLADDSSDYTLAIPDERKSVNLMNTTSKVETSLFLRFSKFSRLQRSVAYCLRFCSNCRVGSEKRYGSLSVEELRLSHIAIMKCIQATHFSRELFYLKSGKVISNSSSILRLNPFLDDNGILRVGGRLQKANIPYAQKHPILLPAKDHLVDLLIRQEHVTLHHAGPQTVLNNLRLRYWPLNVLRRIKFVTKGCVTCFRFKAASAKQIMGDLPFDRISISRPFSKVGIDFGGPISIKNSQLRKAVVSKAYIALFVCMTTKAIHLELVSSLTTASFIGTLKRFISRRGNPNTIYSDNATNFQGANNVLREIYDFLKDNVNSINDWLSVKEIQWKFIPPNSPHWGGLWEAGIKSTKYHLKRVIGSSILSYEHLSTVLVEIEAILNSRPLCQLSTDPTDLTCLTPGHFLIGQPLSALPENDVSSIPVNRLSTWQHCSQMRQHFWQRWSVEYLNRLQHRPKWMKASQNVEKGMMVLVKESNLPPLEWCLARVVEVTPGSDKRVRMAKVRTSKGLFTRAITKLCPLPIET